MELCIILIRTITKRSKFRILRQNELVPTNRRPPQRCAAQHRQSQRGHQQRQEIIDNLYGNAVAISDSAEPTENATDHGLHVDAQP